MAGTDPIHQFNIIKYFTLATVGGDGTPGSGVELAFTNSALFMVAAVAVVSGYLILSTRGRGLVPGRLQLVSEMFYEFVANTVRNSAGTEGMRFFPFVFCIFMFVLTVNIFGLIPYSFTVTSHVIVTSVLALVVFFTVLGYGLYRHGFHFLNLFVPKGVPSYILPMIVAIEVLSFLSRPISHSIRLFGNMLAGHIALQVFAGFIILLGGGLGAIGWIGGVVPFAMIVALFALETLVAVIQAYVFAILTCIYLNDAIHPGH